MNGQGLILITRPSEDAQEYARELQNLGYKTFVEPMLEIVPVGFSVPDLSVYRGLIFTSANGVRIFSKKSPERNIETFCVGQNTSEQTRKAGYKNVHNAGGDAAQIVPLILSRADTNTGTFLHIRGEDVARPVDEMFAGSGIKVETLVVYKAEKVKTLSNLCIKKIRTGEIVAVTFFSRRTAENFLFQIDANGLGDSLAGIKALCISQGVLECVRSRKWGGTYTSSQPDRQGMLEIIVQVCGPANICGEETKIMTKANQDNNESVINNAQDVIEKFGGIRPMASKMSVPVTTVQGWKKRNVIPGSRLEALVKAASEHNVDLGGLLERTDIANQNENTPAKIEAKIEQPEQPKQARIVPEVRAQDQTPQNASASAPQSGNDNNRADAKNAEAGNNDNNKKSGGGDGRPPLQLQNSVEKLFAAAENKAVARSTLINAGLIVVMIAALVALFWPKVEQVEQIQSEVEAVKEEQSLLRGLIPDDMEQRVDNLREQAQQAQETVSEAVDAAKVISEDVLAENAGTLQERAISLENHIADMAGGSPQVAVMIERVQQWQQSFDGQQRLDQTIGSLTALVSGLGGNMENFSAALAQAQTENPALGETFQGVPQEELKAAAMLLVLSNFRSALGRDNESFESDLQLLTNFVGDENPELKASLEALAPNARDGILTPQGLSNELRSMAGDAVVASLSGEDITVQERARARTNELFQLEKNGELVTGTDTQVTLARSQNLLESGEIESAIAQIQTIQGPAAEVLAPFVGKARATLLAHKVEQLAAQIINMQAFGENTAAPPPELQ